MQWSPGTHAPAQALQCLVNILRSLVEWYIRAVPSLNPTDRRGGAAPARRPPHGLAAAHVQAEPGPGRWPRARRGRGPGRSRLGSGSGQGGEGAAANAPPRS